MMINKYIDHTLLKPAATQEEISKLCNEAIKYKFYAVCVNGSYVKFAKEKLKDSNVKIAAVIGFPLGAMTTEAKVFGAKNCIEHGADEIDMVINIGYLKGKEYAYVEKEIFEIKQAIGEKILKVIFENAALSKDEIKLVSKLSENAGADYIKTSTGFGDGGATFEDVKLMRESVGDHVKIKAAGGIRDVDTAKKYIEMGVERLGTSSGVLLVTTGLSDKNSY
ncbi:deoxyribose-phosphate aldolase [Flavobacteriaceae bacterium S356]|uniref:Deoxyribose-phosphate aldolase n=1 Tax=Asprobacillus argus TaxID=3076534 RepID=A0ABU3LK01_9FLAO|nr:deoxyribose-phosphate aldolase [Flavobacteriaceae bacterium S356]